MEMQTRNCSWSPLLCSKGQSPGRSRAPSHIPESLLGGEHPTEKGAALCQLAGGGGDRGGLRDQHPEGHLSAPQPHVLLRTRRATELPPPSQQALAAPGNIALFLPLRLFSFLVENAKYSEG